MGEKLACSLNAAVVQLRDCSLGGFILTRDAAQHLNLNIKSFPCMHPFAFTLIQCAYLHNSLLKRESAGRYVFTPQISKVN